MLLIYCLAILAFLIILTIRVLRSYSFKSMSGPFYAGVTLLWAALTVYFYIDPKLTMS